MLQQSNAFFFPPDPDDEFINEYKNRVEVSSDEEIVTNNNNEEGDMVISSQPTQSMDIPTEENKQNAVNCIALDLNSQN